MKKKKDKKINIEDDDTIIDTKKRIRDEMDERPIKKERKRRRYDKENKEIVPIEKEYVPVELGPSKFIPPHLPHARIPKSVIKDVGKLFTAMKKKKKKKRKDLH